MDSLNIVSRMNDATVVAEYKSEFDPTQVKYQTEAQLEASFIKQLVAQGYENLNINDETSLIKNLRLQLEKLNKLEFTDKEWVNFFSAVLASKSLGIVEKTRMIQEEEIVQYKREDGSLKNIRLIDKKNIHNNSLQLINQYKAEDGKRKNRYDVTILVNGFPMVHIELKRRGTPIRKAFDQIERYQNESFWSGSGLYEYIQLFVISNGTSTKYYSNTTRDLHIKEKTGYRHGKKANHSFQFTSFWADAQNARIEDLLDFTKTFFAKHTLLNILTKYCVFTADESLLVMRPYQVVATERIITKIKISAEYKMEGSLDACGYIWHTTGSGKTLTSFKTARLASQLACVEKVLFIVDRKDLDYQTMVEYDKFEKGAANSNTSTAKLKKQLEDPDAKIIITTIQKLDNFISKNKNHPVFKEKLVMIFDECHRSQFGSMHSKITKHFKKYHMFGFTGTPIVAENASWTGNPLARTTEQVFGERLHAYTIVDAINDGNVLPFRIDFINTVKSKEDIEDKEVASIDYEKALMAPERIAGVVSYVLEHFDQKTNRNVTYRQGKTYRHGFNSIFAASSIDAVKKYYLEFKKQLKEKNKDLVIATIFSYSPNEEREDIWFSEETADTLGLDKSSRDFLDDAIADYNKIFNTNFDTGSEKFQNYYKDVSMRTKRGEVDILLVVNMFLTGFDATTLNTLWVDKNLRQHGLLQAFSRTNRILNSVKTFGNIVCFRNLQEETDEAIALFGNKQAKGIVLMRTYDEYMQGYSDDKGYHPGYLELVQTLLDKFPLPMSDIMTEDEIKEFVNTFSALLRARNILTAFDEFEGNDSLSPRQLQDYQSKYLDLKPEREQRDKEDIRDDLIFEMELVKQIEVDIGYILELIEKYQDSKFTDYEIVINIRKAVDSSVSLRSKKELIEKFLETINADSHVTDDWSEFVKERYQADLDKLIKEHNLQAEAGRRFMENALKVEEFKTIGPDFDAVLPPVSLFASEDENKAAVARKIAPILEEFYNTYRGLVF